MRHLAFDIHKRTVRQCFQFAQTFHKNLFERLLIASMGILKILRQTNFLYSFTHDMNTAIRVSLNVWIYLTLVYKTCFYNNTKPRISKVRIELYLKHFVDIGTVKSGRVVFTKILYWHASVETAFAPGQFVAIA